MDQNLCLATRLSPSPLGSHPATSRQRSCMGLTGHHWWRVSGCVLNWTGKTELWVKSWRKHETSNYSWRCSPIHSTHFGWLRFWPSFLTSGKNRQCPKLWPPFASKGSHLCWYRWIIIEGSLEVKLPTIWTDEKQSREEAEKRERLEERRSEEKESEDRRCRCAKR